MYVLDLPSLVLDSTHKPTQFTNVRKALENVFSEKATTLINYEDRFVHSPSVAVPAPKVIIGYCGAFRNTARWTKLNVLYRDNLCCSYCGERFTIEKLNVDHIVPKSKFIEFTKNPHLHEKFKKIVGINEVPKNRNSWLNTVCTCKKCNSKKENKYLWNSTHKLLIKPFVPKYTPRIVVTIQYAEKTGFLPYLEKFNDNINVKLVDRVA